MTNTNTHETLIQAADRIHDTLGPALIETAQWLEVCPTPDVQAAHNAIVGARLALRRMTSPDPEVPTSSTTAVRLGSRVTVTWPDGRELRYGGARAALPFLVVNEGQHVTIGARADRATADKLAARNHGRTVIEVR